MRAKLLHHNGERVFALVFDAGDDPMQGLQRFAAEQRLSAAGFTAIGAFSEAVLGYFDWDKQAYERIPVREQVEVLALVGDSRLRFGRRSSRPPAPRARPELGPRADPHQRRRDLDRFSSLICELSVQKS